jgi:DNA polymerase-3 subunit beta
VEQLNIVGKRSGDGFIAHKATLVNALSRALAQRLMLLDFTVGRKGFLGYLKALAGSNIVKVVPASVNASGTQVNGHKKLKVVCGSNTSYLDDMAWIGDKTPMTLADVRVSPSSTVKPNMGAIELAEALNRVLPFTAKEDNRPVLSCVNFEAGEGKLTLVSADGFRLAVVTLDYDDGEGKALITRDDLRGITNALKRAKRVKLGFEASGQLDGQQNLILDTELIRYKWTSLEGTFPDWKKLIPSEFNTAVQFDTVEAVKAVSSLKVLADSKSYPIDLTIGNGRVVMANTEDKGEAEIPADTSGEVKVRIDGKYLAEALKACGGMVELKLTNAYSPMLFAVDGYQLVVMPMMTSEANEAMKRDKEQAQPAEPAANEPTTEPEVTEAVAEAEAIAKARPKRSRKREKVAVA